MATLTGKLINAKNEPVTDAFSITLYSFGIVQASNELYIGSRWEVTPDVNGDFTIELWNNLEADNTALYQVEHPGGIKYRLSIPSEVTTGDYADYIIHDDIDQNPGVLVRLKALENASPIVLQPRVDDLEISQSAQDVTIGNIQSTVTALDVLTQSHSTAVGKIPGIESDVAAVEIVASDNASDIDTLTSAVSANNGQISSIQSDLGNKAEQSELDTVEGRVTDLEAGIGDVTDIPGIKAIATTNLANIEGLDTRLTDAEVETAKVDGIQTQVTSNANQISTNASDIAGKASQTQVDNLTATVNTKASQSDLDTLESDYGTHIHTGTVWTTSQIPNLDASKTTSGTFSAARIPNISASTITDGTLSGEYIFDNYEGLTLRSGSPNIKLEDTDNTNTWWLMAGANKIYFLYNYGDGSDTWTSPHPMFLTHDTKKCYIYGFETWTAGNLPVEEGSWTPYFTTGTGWTYVSQTGTYKRVGSFVHIYNSKISVSAADNTGSAVTIGGLPFTPLGNDWNWNCRLRNTVGFPLDSHLTLYSSTDGYLRLQVTTGSTMAFASVTNNQMADNMEIWVSGTYVTDDV